MKKSKLNDGKGFQIKPLEIPQSNFEKGKSSQKSISGLLETLKKCWAKIVLTVIVITNLSAGAATSQTLKTLRADGIKIVTPDNKEVLLRGVNLGQWLVMEGFMSGDSGVMSQGDMKRKLKDLRFDRGFIENRFEDWRNNFITKKDIDFIASKGFNVVRLPMHYDLFLTREQRSYRHDVIYENNPSTKESKYNTYKSLLKYWVDKKELAENDDLDGFAIIDNLVSWCKANGIYIILDMHIVPGTAGHQPHITDRIHTAKDFFYDLNNRLALYRIWGKISERYKNEPTICMYDLINEPHGINQEVHMARLRNAYNQIIKDIRNNGDNTLICIQGNEWGNQYKFGDVDLFPDSFEFNDNLVYNIHRYREPNNTWEPNEWGHEYHTANFADAIDFQDEFTVPMFVGETGLDNIYDSLAANFDIMDDLKFGWTLWTLKHHNDYGENKCLMDILGPNPYIKDDPQTGVPADYSHWSNGDLINAIKFENCVANPAPEFWKAIAPRYPLVHGNTYRIINYNSGKALDVADPFMHNGNNVHQWTYQRKPNQHWIATYNNGWTLTNERSARVLSIEGDSNNNGANAHQWTHYSSNNYQKWWIEWTDGHAYKIENKGSNKLLEVDNSSTAKGANVQQWGTSFINSRKWIFVPVFETSLKSTTLNDFSEVVSVQNDVIMYPTLVSGLLNIDGTTNYSTLRVLNSAGQLVKTIALDNQSNLSVNMGAFAPGLYFIELSGNNGIVTKKVMKK